MENNFNVDLASMDSTFDNKTLRYRINGFAYACGMRDIQIEKTNASNNPIVALNTEDGRVTSDTVFYNSGVYTPYDPNVGAIVGRKENKRTCEGLNYFIAVNKSDKGLFGENITISGNYGDLNFSFINYYDNKKLDKKVVELPFAINLAKEVNKENYVLTIETVKGIVTKITFYRYHEHKKRTVSYKHDFYVNILDFSDVLKLVKAFAYNPELVFSTYNKVLEEKRVVFTTHDMNEAIMQDINLDEPVGKVKRKINEIIRTK